jgi:hypothetical protein
MDPDADPGCDRCHGSGDCPDCGGRVLLCDRCGENERHCRTCDCTGMCPECVRPKYREGA